jgi:hypothetical protein
LHEQNRAELLAQAAEDTQRALELGLLLYEQGVVDYQRVLDAASALVRQQDSVAESQGQVALNLVALYKALAGGWQMGYPAAAEGSTEPVPAAEPGPLPPPAAPLPPPGREGDAVLPAPRQNPPPPAQSQLPGLRIGMQRPKCEMPGAKC